MRQPPAMTPDEPGICQTCGQRHGNRSGGFVSATCLDAALAEVERLRAALATYAGHDNWSGDYDDEKYTWTLTDRGWEVAEAALQPQGE